MTSNKNIENCKIKGTHLPYVSPVSASPKLHSISMLQAILKYVDQNDHKITLNTTRPEVHVSPIYELLMFLSPKFHSVSLYN